MPITLRSVREPYPGCPTKITNPLSCTNYPTLQLLAKAIQEQVTPSSFGVIVGGVVLTNLIPTDVTTLLCESV